MNLNDKALSAIRTGVPMIVGWLASFLIVHFGFAIPQDVQGWLTALLGFGIGYAYYLGVRYLEGRWPQLGWLLGAPVQPMYTPPPGITVTRVPGPIVSNPPNAP